MKTNQSGIIRVDYEKLASEYDVRYTQPAEAEPRGQVLLSFAAQLRTRRILEVGCGTGHWLQGLEKTGATVFGLDFSRGMLEQAERNISDPRLVQGSALDLPYSEDSFDLVYCVDAFHHFGDPQLFLKQVYRILRPGGNLAILCNDPHSGEVIWYGYEYFDGTLETDLKRFPPHKHLIQWMSEIGYDGVSSTVVENLDQPHQGREILLDRFLKKKASSQFALLSDVVYQMGLRKIEAALHQAESEGREIIFNSKWPVRLLSGHKPKLVG